MRCKIFLPDLVDRVEFTAADVGLDVDILTSERKAAHAYELLLRESQGVYCR